MKDTEILEVFDKLKDMKPEERKNYLREKKITKTLICDNLLNNPQFANIPMKSLVINSIKDMSDDQFLDFVIKNISRIPTSILKKMI